VDMSGYVTVDTNRYSVPERLVGQTVEVHKGWVLITRLFPLRFKVLFWPRHADNGAGYTKRFY